MKLDAQDWRRLRYPLIALGLTLILIILLVGYAEQRKKTAQEELTKQQGMLNLARQRYQSSGAEKDTIIKYLPMYQQLIKDGFVGEERRIEWVDNLRTIQQQYKLFGINYTIDAQDEYKPSFAANMGALKLYRSVMKLELLMLHEGDLLTMLDALTTVQNTPFVLRQCEITRLASGNPGTLRPSLVAKCELDWLTVHEPPVAVTGTP